MAKKDLMYFFVYNTNTDIMVSIRITPTTDEVTNDMFAQQMFEDIVEDSNDWYLDDVKEVE